MEPRLEIKKLAPESYRRMAALDASAKGLLEASLRELVRIRVSQVNGCAYCIDMHTKDARAAGETEQRIYALSAWREAPFFSERERAALALAEAVTLITGGVPDDVYDQAARHFDEAELAELIWVAVAMNAWNRVAVTTRAWVPGSYEPGRRPAGTADQDRSAAGAPADHA